MLTTPTSPKPQAKNLSQVAEEFVKDVLPGELQDLLEAVRTLKHGSGWGAINVIYINHEIDTLDIKITRKPKKQKSV